MFGNALHNLFGTLSDLLSGVGLEIEEPQVKLPGFMGLTAYYILKALGGDLVSSLVLFILMGQTVALVVTYIKRLFYCIFLGMLAPLIVAVDVIKKSLV